MCAERRLIFTVAPVLRETLANMRRLLRGRPNGWVKPCDGGRTHAVAPWGAGMVILSPSGRGQCGAAGVRNGPALPKPQPIRALACSRMAGSSRNEVATPPKARTGGGVGLGRSASLGFEPAWREGAGRISPPNSRCIAGWGQWRAIGTGRPRERSASIMRASPVGGGPRAGARMACPALASTSPLPKNRVALQLPSRYSHEVSPSQPHQ